jgi:4-hydroxy-3-polyprenylbenzoate decarboxylase
MKRCGSEQVWQALNLAVSAFPTPKKFIIAVDEDIDAKDPDSVNWALSWCVQPHRDTRIVKIESWALDPSDHPPEMSRMSSQPSGGSALLINATRKWDYPPVSLPRKDFMERARQIWEEENLPEISPKVPWFGYSLGCWTDELQEEAELALQGKHHQTGEKLAKQRVKVRE